MPDPRRPKPGDVVLKVIRAAICGTDASEWSHGPRLARPPVILGHEFVGRVEAIGGGVESLTLGDRVVSGAGVSCGTCQWCKAGRSNLCVRYYTLGLQADGGLAEFVTSPADICRGVPETVGDNAAAMAQPLAVALHAVARSGVAEGQTCVVIGCGGIGAFIVAAAVFRGAKPVIAVDIDEERLKTANQLGAHQTINARGADLASEILAATDGDGADVVIEATGAPHAPAAAIAATRRGGRALIVGLQSAPRELDLLALTACEVEIGTTLAHVCNLDLPESLKILEQTRLAEIVLDRVIPLEQLVDEGIRALAERTARGKILVDPRAL